jgi:hypothetical protein
MPSSGYTIPSKIYNAKPKIHFPHAPSRIKFSFEPGVFASAHSLKMAVASEAPGLKVGGYTV